MIAVLLVSLWYAFGALTRDAIAGCGILNVVLAQLLLALLVAWRACVEHKLAYCEAPGTISTRVILHVHICHVIMQDICSVDSVLIPGHENSDI